MDLPQWIHHVDHTLLRPTASWAEVDALCSEAVFYKTACVCVPLCYVSRIRQKYESKLRICTVVGFPLGYSPCEVKVMEAHLAISEGADEVDMVINLTAVKNGHMDAVAAEIRALKQAVGCHVLKVIVETCFLSDAEKIALCACVTNAGADYIKTSTGFGTGGATLADIILFKQHIGPQVKIKAAGGVKTQKDILDFLNAGCERIGTSSAIKILKEETFSGY